MQAEPSTEATGSTEEYIRLEAVRKSFADKPVLRGVDLAIRRGETMVILGASGSGKSVLLRHVNGLHKPDSGRVCVDGEEISKWGEVRLTEVRKKVGMLFQSGALFDSMSVFENVAFPLREHTDHDEDQIRARVLEKLRLVELEDVEDLMPVNLSGGMKKRVALARAIVLEPRGILYDEPTTGLDPVTANHINRLIRGLQSRLGVTSVVVTHDIESAFFVGDRVAYLLEGEIRFVGTVEEARAGNEVTLKRFLQGVPHDEE